MSQHNVAPCWAGCLSAIERSGFVDPGVACWTLLVVMFLLVVELQACCSAKALAGVDAAFGGLLVRFVGCCGVLAECLRRCQWVCRDECWRGRFAWLNWIVAWRKLESVVC